MIKGRPTRAQCIEHVSELVRTRVLSPARGRDVLEAMDRIRDQREERHLEREDVRSRQETTTLFILGEIDRAEFLRGHRRFSRWSAVAFGLGQFLSVLAVAFLAPRLLHVHVSGRDALLVGMLVGLPAIPLAAWLWSSIGMKRLLDWHADRLVLRAGPAA